MRKIWNLLQDFWEYAYWSIFLFGASGALIVVYGLVLRALIYTFR